ncbi:hypothetical protein OPV22_027238 [Ensete ventricosum]|uniref:Uncharacterized protein n=1 Tax=Ensete ventricosum TaxID=4639 RepID=A0AAV8P403_ENSVE|nr:hypothetical protein OPV22_027238 [Ensete ventricosum]
MKLLRLGIKCTKARRRRQLSLSMQWKKNERSIDLQMLPKLSLLCICFSVLTSQNQASISFPKYKMARGTTTGS